MAAASRRGKAALESLFSAAAAAAAGNVAGAPSLSSSSSSAPASAESSSYSFSAIPPSFPPATKPWWRAHAVNVGEAEAASLSPEELGAARAAAAPGGVALSEVGFVSSSSAPSKSSSASPSSPSQAAIESLYRRGIVYLSVPLTPDDSVWVPPLEGFVSNKGGIGGGAKKKKRSESSGGGGGREGEGSGSDDDFDDDERPEAGNKGDGDSDEDPVEPLLYALLVVAGGEDDDDESDENEEESPKNDGDDGGDGEKVAKVAGSNPSSPSSSPMTVRRLAEEILGLDLGAALAAASLAVRLGFARKGKERKAKEKEKAAAAAASLSSSPSSSAANDDDDGNKVEEGNLRSPPPPSIALIVDAAVTSSLMAGALSPGLKTHAVSLFEGGRVGGRKALSDLLKELDATREAAAGFGAAEGGIAELAADAAALAVVIRALRESGRDKEKKEDGKKGPLPKVELLRREALESSLPRGAAARLLRANYSAVVSVAATEAEGAGAGGGRRSSLRLWSLCGSGPPRGALALPPGLVLRKLPGLLEGAPAVALWCWRGGGGGGSGSTGNFFDFGGEKKREVNFPRAPRGLPVSDALLGAGIARAPFLLQALNEALSSRRSLGGGVLAVPLPAAALGRSLDSLSLSSLSLSSSSAGEAGASSPSPSLSFADLALPVSSSDSPSLLEAVDLFTGQRVSFEAPPRWGTAVREMALSSCVGVVRFCRFSPSAAASPSSPSPSPSSWFPLGIRLGIPLSPRPTCDAVCAALAASDLMMRRGGGGAAEEREREEGKSEERRDGSESSPPPSGPSLLLPLSRALVFDGGELRPAAASRGKKAVLGRRCLQGPGAVFEV